MAAEKRLLRPLPLRGENIVAVFSPSGAVSRRILLEGLKTLEGMGLNYYLASNIYARYRYLAGRDEERAEALVQLLSLGFPGLWASRGGFGALRLLSLLEKLLPSSLSKPFWLLGFSDVSILLNYFWERYGLITLHAPVVSSLPETSINALAVLRGLLFGSLQELFYPAEGWQEGEAEGFLVGGNLATLASLLGTPWFPCLKDRILFLEEINESPYRVDRLFSQLKAAGVLDKVKALALGDFSGLPSETLREIVLEHYQGPILSGLPVGHGVDNFPLLIGAPTKVVIQGPRGYLKQIIPP